jgi:hypothetical protein
MKKMTTNSPMKLTPKSMGYEQQKKKHCIDFATNEEEVERLRKSCEHYRWIVIRVRPSINIF